MKLLIGCALAALAASAVIVALVLGTPSASPAPPSPVPSVFCPAGQHLTGVRAGMPECAVQPAPRRTVLGVIP